MAPLRVGYGAACLVSPDLVVRSLGGRPGPAVRTAARLLGVRDVVQPLLSVRHPVVRRVGRAADVAHAASMVALAVVRPDLRRTALASAAVTTTWVVLGSVPA